VAVPESESESESEPEVEVEDKSEPVPEPIVVDDMEGLDVQEEGWEWEFVAPRGDSKCEEPRRPWASGFRDGIESDASSEWFAVDTDVASSWDGI
jgi:hypothetical protein